MAEIREKIRNIKMEADIRPIKLKGHVKVTLHNPRTGKNEIQEGENIITNAVADIFANNYVGGIDYSKAMPIWSKWMGGILCYESPFATSGSPAVPDPADYFPQGNDINKLVAHAGRTTPTPTDLQEDRGRGFLIDTVLTDGKVKQVFEWGSLQGNGVISALSLTHTDTGDVGLGSTSSAFRNFKPFEELQGANLSNVYSPIDADNAIVAQYDDRHGLMYLAGGDGEYASHKTGFTSGTNKVTIYIKQLPYKKAGLFEAMTAVTTYQKIMEVTTQTTWYLQPAYYFDYATKKLWLFSNITGYNNGFTFSKTNMNYAIIDCTTGTVDSEGTIVSDDSDLAPIAQQATGIIYMYLRFTNIIKDGNYVYLPTGTGSTSAPSNADITGLKRINIVDGTDAQKTLTFNETQAIMRPYVKGGGLIINSGRVINGDTGYTCQNFLPNTGYADTNYGFSQPNKINNYVVTLGSIDSPYTSPVQKPRYIMANKMINSTKFNLPESITKDTSKSLTIEYTLEEV